MEVGTEIPVRAKTCAPRYRIMSHLKGCPDNALRTVSELRLDSVLFRDRGP